MVEFALLHILQMYEIALCVLPRKPKGLNRMTKIDYCHLCLMEERKKTKGPKQDSQNCLMSPMSVGRSKLKSLNRIAQIV